MAALNLRITSAEDIYDAIRRSQDKLYRYHVTDNNEGIITVRRHKFIMAFKRWQNVPEVQQEVSKLEDYSRKHRALLSEGSTDSKIQAQKLWSVMSSSYWDILLALVDAQTQANPDTLKFDAEERLFIDLGCLPGTLDLSPNFDPQAFLSAKCSGGILPIMTLSDYIAESWASINANPSPVPLVGMSSDGRTNYLTKFLDQLCKLRDKELAAISSAYSPALGPGQLSQAMNDSLMPYMKVAMRVPEYREGTESERQKLGQQRKAYLDAENSMLLAINSARKKEADPLPAPRAEKFLQIHELTKTLAREILYSQNDIAKIARRTRKISDACASMSLQMRRSELRTMLVKKRDYLTVPAKTARTDTSLLCVPNSMPADYAKLYSLLEEMCRMDIAMFNVPRVRMYGLPRAIFVPGQGLGTYDWSDHSLLLPAFPTNGEDKSVSYALATFRWDSDEDRRIKNPYEQIKENRKKSIMALASSFYKDYSLWMTKEKKGYRILPSETHKAFVQMFKPKADE
ncbi:MAG: hypothetical protein II954_01815 [Synergistaceae bacterium]|nr:hypothetical protein [Synergistaceae bacterium]